MLKYWLSVPLIGITLILAACSESPNSSGGVLMSKGGGGDITLEPVGGGNWRETSATCNSLAVEECAATVVASFQERHPGVESICNHDIGCSPVPELAVAECVQELCDGRIGGWMQYSFTHWGFYCSSPSLIYIGRGCDR